MGRRMPRGDDGRYAAFRLDEPATYDVTGPGLSTSRGADTTFFGSTAFPGLPGSAVSTLGVPSLQANSAAAYMAERRRSHRVSVGRRPESHVRHDAGGERPRQRTIAGALSPQCMETRSMDLAATASWPDGAHCSLSNVTLWRQMTMRRTVSARSAAPS